MGKSGYGPMVLEYIRPKKNTKNCPRCASYNLKTAYCSFYKTKLVEDHPKCDHFIERQTVKCTKYDPVKNFCNEYNIPLGPYQSDCKKCKFYGSGTVKGKPKNKKTRQKKGTAP